MADYAYELINSYRVSATSITAFVNVYGDRNDYALSEMTRDGVDTVGVWGSNPHAPTISIAISFNKLPYFLSNSFSGFQRICRNFAESKPKMFCLDEPGFSRTSTALTIVSQLRCA